MNLICDYCNKAFKTSHKDRKNCSKKCHNISTKGVSKNANSKHPAWKGGKVNKHGYILVHKPEHPYCDKDRRVKEHRLVVEEKIGRYLDPKEVVHHINHITWDNRIENLILFKNQGDHLRHHNLTRKRK